eukprot:COSAG06_NODE_15976_length_1031_cov_1.919528_2_plen_261_part_01
MPSAVNLDVDLVLGIDAANISGVHATAISVANESSGSCEYGITLTSRPLSTVLVSIEEGGQQNNSHLGCRPSGSSSGPHAGEGLLMQAYSVTHDDPVWSVQLLMESERSADFVNEGTGYELSFTSGFAELEIPGFGAEGALFAVRWRGVVFVEHPGEYEFILLSDVSGHTALDIDRERVVENNGATASGVRLRRLIVPVLDGVDECVDQPLGWVSNDGTPCSSYETMGFCTPTGAYGSAWTTGYGTFADYAVNGVDASQAC